MISKFWHQLRQDFEKDPVTFILELLGTAASMGAAVLLSLEITGLIPVYLCWLVGSVCLTVSSARRKNINLIMLMIFYTIMNLIGLWNYSV